MSTIAVEILPVTYVKPHPDADKLEIAIVCNRTVVVPKGEYKKDDAIIYFPPDMLIPEDVADQLGVKKYLKHAVYPGDAQKTKCRVGACRLRGQPSYGFPAPFSKFFDGNVVFGTNVSSFFKAVKYEPPQKIRAEDAAPDHPAFHQYTDIEHYYRFPEVFPEGMWVRVTEKIHGSNQKAGLINVDGEWQFMCGSHRVNRKPGGLYWEPLNENLMALLTDLCDEQHNVILFGEIFGPGIQDMDYGVERGKRGYRVFDISVNGRYLDWEFVQQKCVEHDVETVPLLAIRRFTPEIIDEYTYGDTIVGSPRGDFKGREGGRDHFDEGRLLRPHWWAADREVGLGRLLGQARCSRPGRSRVTEDIDNCTVRLGDCRDVLRTLPDNHVHCCITSPPYLGLRNYGVDGQIGHEGSLNEYVASLADIFDEVKRVLRPDGTLWLNIGDSYTAKRNSGVSRQRPTKRRGTFWGGRTLQHERGATCDFNGLMPKNLCGIPWRVAFALQARGWYLRSDIIWHKPNAKPESVKDRPSKAHEYVFLFSKSASYAYDHNAIKEPVTSPHGKYQQTHKNKRTVWSIPTESWQGLHVAVFPTKLVEPCILAGCPVNGTVLDPFCGSGTTLVVARRLGRKAIGCELNPDYVEFAYDRLRKDRAA